MTRNKKSPENAQRNMNRFKNILFYTVLTLLLLSAIFTLVMIVVAPADRDLDEAFTKVKSDYILMFIQCRQPVSCCSPRCFSINSALRSPI